MSVVVGLLAFPFIIGHYEELLTLLVERNRVAKSRIRRPKALSIVEC